MSQANLSVTREAPGWFHPGRSGAIKLGPTTVLGVFGEVHPDLLAKLKIDPPVGVFDVFTGQGVPAGKKSLAIEVTLQPKERTLTDAEIEAVAGRIVEAVKKATGGELRG